MADPLAEVVTLLQPSARFSKSIAGSGPWAIRRSDAGQPFYCAVLEGGCHLAVDGQPPFALRAGDFVLVPAAYGVAMTSLQPSPPGTETQPQAQGAGRYRIGHGEGPVDLRMLVGHCHFGSPDAALLVSLLPQVVHVRDERRLATLVELVGDESHEQRPAREVVLAHLLEVLLIEALRSGAGTAASPGLVRALADPRLAASPPRCARCTRAPRTHGPWPSWRRKPRCRARRSSNASSAPWAWRRWNTCWPGAWPWPRTCCAAAAPAWPRSPNAPAIAPPAPSAWRSRGTWG